MDVRDLFGEVRREVRGAPNPRMAYALERAAREFCSETRLLRRSFQFTCNPSQANPQQYPVSAPANEQAFALKHAQIQTLPITNPAQWLPMQIQYSEFFNPAIGPTTPWGICYIPYTMVALNCNPDQAYPVKVELCTQNVVGSNYIPDEIGVRYARALGFGALEWLFRQKGNPWYDPNEADKMLVKFNQEIVKGRGEAMFDFSPGVHMGVRPGFMRRGWGR